ncbi:MAG: ribosome modulation factor [Gammaproteobacteria bacterium]|jgi:ribosome modulation factor|nr:ribosome modulation factor [Gammaproteobacteria bacterium]MBQ0773742.1 ribosome modulation factor [Gammaproteobacteria bacterium]|tara:strand:- start:62518 stop:62727 length:210 start_codon:yes stop_codon:yes gene_type:complete
MKRQKRDRDVRAYSRGYKAGLDGKSRDLCPFEDNLDMRSHWLGGWREGRTDQSHGMTGVSGIHNMKNIG